MKKFFILFLILFLSSCAYNIEYNKKTYSVKAFSKDEALKKAQAQYLLDIASKTPICFLYKDKTKIQSKENISQDTILENGTNINSILESNNISHNKNSFYNDYYFDKVVNLENIGTDYQNQDFIIDEKGNISFKLIAFTKEIILQLDDCISLSDYEKDYETQKTKLIKKQLLEKIDYYKKEKIKLEKESKLRKEKIVNSLLKETCSSDNWNAYTFGEFFSSKAKEFGLQPFNLVAGNNYELRNINSYSRQELEKDFIRYNVVFLQGLGLYDTFINLMEKEGKAIALERTLTFAERYEVIDKKDAFVRKSFNKIVKKHSACYQKLK